MATSDKSPRDPKSAYISTVRSIAADKSWAQTPNRAERTAAARAASPNSLTYWIAKVRADGVVREQDVQAAGQNAYRAYMREKSLKAAAARRAKSRKAAGETAA
ncbi:hypothetical protein [Nonomuraea sp. NPDC048901]|uniref:hypothetical protein n=1 Tax=Nonomuraea sp. NPDC048901 TaxID=3155627 RepID=UPI0033C4AE3F